MKNATILVLAIVLAGGCKKPREQDPEPAEPAAIEESAEPAAVEEEAAEESAEPAPPAMKPPKSFGIEVCDEYAELACSCEGKVIGSSCERAHKIFGEWRKIAKHKGMRSFVEQGCKEALANLENACR